MDCVPITRNILMRAARLRATENFRTPDAIQVATAQLQACDLNVVILSYLLEGEQEEADTGDVS